jgi:Tfp pilus assembly pilus retraction ATPase PilT
MSTLPANITASIPRNDMGRLVATTFVIVAAVKAVEKLQKMFKRKKRPDVREVLT